MTAPTGRDLIAALFTTPASTLATKRRRGSTPESTVLRAVVREFDRAGILCERRSVSFDRERRISHGTPGEPDLRLSSRGRTAGVEVKAARGRLSESQRRWHAKHAEHVPTWTVDSVSGAREVIRLITGPTWPVPGADLRGMP